MRVFMYVCMYACMHVCVCVCVCVYDQRMPSRRPRSGGAQAPENTLDSQNTLNTLDTLWEENTQTGEV